MGANLPYMPFHLPDWIEDTQELTNEELGALVRIRWALWRSGGIMAEGRLVRASRAGRRWGAVSGTVLAKLTVDGAKVSCRLVLDQLIETRKRHEAAVANGGKGGKASARTALRGGPDRELEGRLNSSNPLKSHEAGGSGAWPSLEQAPSNQNQNHLEKNLIRLGSPTDQAAAGTALDTEGLSLLRGRTDVSAAAARKELVRWHGQLDGDAITLLRILRETAERGLSGHAYGRTVATHVDRIERERRKGGSLPFPPKVVGGAG